MADHHLQTSHKLDDNPKPAEFDKSDEDELQPLLFDLVAANNFEAVNALSPYIEQLNDTVRQKLAISAVSAGSPTLLRLFLSPNFPAPIYMWTTVIQSGNINMSEVLISNLQMWSERHFTYVRADGFGLLFVAIIESDSPELYKIWSPVLSSAFGIRKVLGVVLAGSTSRPAIAATKDDESREQLLLKFWKEHDVLRRISAKQRVDALVHVAWTTCSINLARYLLKHGCEVDGRRSDRYMTPLHCAAQHNTAQAAHFIEFLLMEGANPNTNSKKRDIRNEKGAIGISAWLGVSWDELVERTTKERQRKGKGIEEDNSSNSS